MDATGAVLLYSGRLPVGQKKLDAIIVEMRAYFSPESEVVMAVPYTPRTAGAFRVHKPKLLAWLNCDDFDVQEAMQSFFEGSANITRAGGFGTIVWMGSRKRRGQRADRADVALDF